MTDKQKPPSRPDGIRGKERVIVLLLTLAVLSVLGLGTLGVILLIQYL